MTDKQIKKYADQAMYLALALIAWIFWGSILSNR